MGTDSGKSKKIGKCREANANKNLSLQKDRITSKELRQRLHVECVMDVIRRGRLRWYGHVMRKQDEDWVKKCINMDVAGKMPTGRPKLTWMDTVNSDMDRMDLMPVLALDRNVWRRLMSRRRKANLGLPR
jgi:hypothetical protein